MSPILNDSKTLRISVAMTTYRYKSVQLPRSPFLDNSPNADHPTKITIVCERRNRVLAISTESFPEMRCNGAVVCDAPHRHEGAVVKPYE